MTDKKDKGERMMWWQNMFGPPPSRREPFLSAEIIRELKRPVRDDNPFCWFSEMTITPIESVNETEQKEGKQSQKEGKHSQKEGKQSQKEGKQSQKEGKHSQKEGKKKGNSHRKKGNSHRKKGNSHRKKGNEKHRKKGNEK